MFERPLVILRRLSRKLWVRVSAFAVLSLTSALMGTVLEASLSPALTDRFDLEGLMPVLTILASSMLAVSTFSLNVMVSAHLSAAAQATPRVHRLLLDDTTTQNVLSVFIGAFVYALSSIILLKAQAYASSSAVIMLVVTIAVVVLVILALLRWIDHLSDLGSLDATLDLTESHARTALTALRQRPALGACR